MTARRLTPWFTVVSVIMVLFGIIYAVLGLGVLPVARAVLAPWEGAIYGAMMMGWGISLAFLGRTAFRRNDAELMRPILLGLAVWLLVEAVASARFGVWFNVGVDMGVLALFAIPLIIGIRSAEKGR